MLLLSMVMAAALAVGGPLPSPRGEDLMGAKVELPRDARGHATLFIPGFKYGSHHAAADWAKRYRQEFERLERVRFCEIPMIGGMTRLGKWFIGPGMKRGTLESGHRRVITAPGGTGDWKKVAGYAGREAAYLILLDSEGLVRFVHMGKMDDGAWRKLASATRRWADGPHRLTDIEGD